MFFPLDEDFNFFIQAIAHPTCQFKRISLLFYEKTESYALNGAINKDMCAFHFGYSAIPDPFPDRCPWLNN